MVLKKIIILWRHGFLKHNFVETWFSKTFFFQFQDFHFLCPNDTVFDQQVRSLCLKIYISHLYLHLICFFCLQNKYKEIKKKSKFAEWHHQNTISINYAIDNNYEIYSTFNYYPFWYQPKSVRIEHFCVTNTNL